MFDLQFFITSLNQMELIFWMLFTFDTNQLCDVLFAIRRDNFIKHKTFEIISSSTETTNLHVGQFACLNEEVVFFLV